MFYIFFSHSSADELEALTLKRWLLDNGWDDIFLDLDVTSGSKLQERCAHTEPVSQPVKVT